MLVENIRIAEDGETFYIIGSACTKSKRHPDCTFDGGSNTQGMMYVIRLDEIVGDEWRVCDTGPDSKNYEEFDFDGNCLLGMRRSVMRRSGNAFCANPSDYKVTINAIETCECSMADVECEFGYVRRDANTCAPMKGISLENACPRLANREGLYQVSDSHLRLIHNDACSDVNAVIPDTNGKGGKKGSPEPGGDSGDGGHCKSHSSFIKSLMVLIIVVGAVSVAIGFAWSQCLTPNQQEAAKTALEPVLGYLAAGFEVVLGLIVEAYDWIRAKVRSLTGRGHDDDREYYEALTGHEDNPGLDEIDTEI